jgi:hypothetical protein
MREYEPFDVSSTSTFPKHSFVFTLADDPSTIVKRFHIQNYPANIYAYDPYHVPNDPEKTETNLQALSKEDRAKYDHWRQTLLFNEQYKNVTGRSYLANYLRKPPMHYMWRADYFGQTHWVTTKETHFVSTPPSDLLEPIDAYENRVLRESDPRLLSECKCIFSLLSIYSLSVVAW